MIMNYQKICGLAVLGLVCLGTDCQAMDCTQVSDCATLGYTKSASDCNGKSTVKCPFDTSKVMCSGSAASQNITVGAILYGDGSVSNGLVLDKTPIGVVFDPDNRLALALTDVLKGGEPGYIRMAWMTNEECDIPNLENCTDETKVLTSCGVDGRANTDALLAADGGSCAGNIIAAKAASSYVNLSCSKDFCKKGKWFLPSLRDLNNIYKAKETLQDTLTMLIPLGASLLRSEKYWSSTEFSAAFAWKLGIDDGSVDYVRKYELFLYNVRPVVKY